jgi:hypothetical protein
MLREPDQPTFNLRSEPDLRPPVDPRTLRLREVVPVAGDGDAWMAGVLACARELGESHGRFRPSELRQVCQARGLGAPPSGKAQWWGIAYGRLRDLGWTKELLDETSSVRSRNGAKDVWEWISPRSQSHA